MIGASHHFLRTLRKSHIINKLDLLAIAILSYALVQGLYDQR